MSSPPSTPFNASNVLVGAAVSLFEVTTLGQPLEVLKTHQAATRQDSLRTAIAKTYARGGFRGFYQAWIESSTTGGILLFTSSEVERFAEAQGISRGTAGLLGGITGGAAQAYLAMGICTTMKTAEITRRKSPLVHPSLPCQPGLPPPSTTALFLQTYRAGGWAAINKGVNAVAIRQMTNWGSRMGFARAAETMIRDLKGLEKGEKLGTGDKVLASAIGGALGCWNHPIEVVRVEMQSLAKSSSLNCPAKPTIVNTFAYIYNESGVKGLFRGVTPRLLLGVWRTICLVTLADYVKEIVKEEQAADI